MKIPVYHIDAFTDHVFAGNSAGVCPLQEWPDGAVMQNIARENNLSETAFFVPREGDCHFDIRWFTPKVEIDLCGHATLASAYVIFSHIEPKADRVTFHSRSGELVVSRDGDMLAMDFPAKPPIPSEVPDSLTRALGKKPVEVLMSDDWLAVFSSEDDIVGLAPDFHALRGVGRRGVIVTAPGDEADFVSRFFAPNLGIEEDPVTGSAHCTLIPYWAKRLGKKDMRAVQRSARRGELFCTDNGGRVTIAGHAVQYMVGGIDI